MVDLCPDVALLLLVRSTAIRHSVEGSSGLTEDSGSRTEKNLSPVYSGKLM